MSGYGVDVWCTDQVVSGRLVRGPRVVAQALYRRLITPRGMLRGGDEESAYGFDLSGYIGATNFPEMLGPLPGLIRNELLKDDRVADVAVGVVSSKDAAGLVYITLTINVVLVNEGETFALTVGASETTVELLGFAEAA